MEFSLYQVISGNLLNATVRLLEKIYSSNKRCLFFSTIDERLNFVDKTLWTFSTNAFIPHGTENFGFSGEQPIYLTNKIENPNNSEILFLMDTFDYKLWADFKFERIFFVFEEALKDAINLYETLKKNGEHVNYWQQTKTGWNSISSSN